jgi:uncharacterized membrane protein YjjP (DUF1212 family)
LSIPSAAQGEHPTPPGEGMDFVTTLARELHAAGTPAHRMEDIVTLLAGRLGYEAESFVLPTGIFISFASGGFRQVSLQRVRPGEINLARQCALDEVANAVMHGRIPVAEGRQRLARLRREAAGFPPFFSIMAMALVSGGVVTFFNGGWREALLSTAIGGLVGGLSLLAGRSEALGRVFLLISACLASVLASLVGWWWGGVSVYVCVISSLIVLIPGLTLTTAVNELATGHLAAGTARFFGAMVVLLQIGFGVVLGSGIMQACGVVPVHIEPEALSPWVKWSGVLLTCCAFVVIFQARPRDTHILVVAGLIAYGTVSLGMSHLDNLLGASLAALVVGAAWAAARRAIGTRNGEQDT